MQIIRRNEDEVTELLADAERSLDEGLLPLRVIAHPLIFELEQEKLFSRTWCFLAHDTEIPKPGDYVLRYIGARDSVIVLRDEDGEIRAFLNICRHRGARLVKADIGNTSHFRCTYHGFTYNNKGELIGVPCKNEAYGNALRFEDFGLYPVRIETYKGLVFGNIDGNAPPLNEFLGPVKFYLDFMLDKTGEGVTFYPPERRIGHHNWKVTSDNFIHDNYHVLTTHAFAFDMGFLPKNPLVIAGRRVYCGNGHGIGTNQGLQSSGSIEFPRPIGYPIWWPDLMEKAKNHMPNDEFELWSTLTQMHGNLFPNVGLLEVINNYRDKTRLPPPFKTFKLWRPISHDTTEIWSWFFVENDAPENYKKASCESYTESVGTGGLFEVDDMENWYNITQSSMTAGAKYFKLLYKIGSHQGLDAGWKYPGEASAAGFSEYPGIQFWKTFLKYLTS